MGRRTPLNLTAAGAVAAATVVAGVAGPGPAAAVTIQPLSPTGTVTVQLKGNGHGHGMSQYGAYGAALAGKGYRDILGFYYPGTAIRTLSASSIRVKLGGTGSTVVVLADPNLAVSGIGTLPSTGVRRYRLVADTHSGLTLQRMVVTSTTYQTVRTGLSNRAAFRHPGGSVRLYAPDGTSVRYAGAVEALRNAATGSAAGLTAVNVVSLDNYVRGVVPREMPASWPAAAVAAQEVAARSYGRYAVEHPASPDYDICDSYNCQVYGGHIGYDAHGAKIYFDLPSVADTANQVLTYGGSTIFAQFAASNGGWTTDGGQPYLVARADPYSTAADDAYYLYSRTVKVSQLASYFGLRTVTGIAVTQRDGHGVWGGRVLAGRIYGTTASAPTTTTYRAFQGYDLQYALGAGTTWIAVSAP